MYMHITYFYFLSDVIVSMYMRQSLSVYYTYCQCKRVKYACKEICENVKFGLLLLENPNKYT